MSTVASEATRSIHPPGADAPPPAKGLRGLVQRVVGEPNAIWMREMRQGSRVARTPWILFTLTLVVSLLMCSIGGLAAAENASPAVLGGALFQVFFSIAYLVVVIVGPAIAANGIASEREGRTWEAVLLTGLSPQEIARGKFLAAYTTIALYIVVLAPVGALSFLFGGVTATEVVIAFAWLFMLAALAVAFGLAVSSQMASLRGAIVVTLMLAIAIGPLLYFTCGFGLSFVVHKQWSEVPEAFPIWLPLAYERATFGVDYVLLLFALPTLLVAAPAWFLYETTIANLTGAADDRSTGLKRWFAVTTPLLAAVALVPVIVASDDGTRTGWTIAAVVAFGGYATFCALLFAFEPLTPSRRVRVRWDRANASALRRFLGPGLPKTALLVTSFGLLGLIAVAAIGITALHLFGTGGKRPTQIAETLVLTSYACGFFVFFSGLVAWLRARDNAPWVARTIASGIALLATAAPWVVAAIAGVLSNGHERQWLAIAAPSPVFAFVMATAVDESASEAAVLVPAGLACATAWGFLGLALLAMTARRCARRAAEEDAAIAQTEAALRAEEAALHARDAADAAAGPIDVDEPPAAQGEPG